MWQNTGAPRVGTPTLHIMNTLGANHACHLNFKLDWRKLLSFWTASTVKICLLATGHTQTILSCTGCQHITQFCLVFGQHCSGFQHALHKYNLARTDGPGDNQSYLFTADQLLNQWTLWTDVSLSRQTTNTYMCALLMCCRRGHC